MKRQRGRGGRKPNGQANRHFESSGPDVKIRGSASHICEKYQQLARDAASSGDRVMAENYLQHAEHYFRVVQANQPAQKPRERQETDAEAQPTVAATNGVAPGDAQPVITEDDAAPAESGPMDIVAAPETEGLVSGEPEPEAPPAPARRTTRTRRPRTRAAAATAAETTEAREALEAAPDADAGA